MGAKWSTVSTTTYADNSPADDGTATEANRVKFSTIKSDLTDPLDTAIDSIVANLDELFDESTTAVSTNYTTVASDHSTILEVTNGTITLLAAGTAGAGYRVGVYASGARATVTRSGSDTIDGETSVTLPEGTLAWFHVNAAGNGYLSSRQKGILAAGTETSVASLDITGFASGYTAYRIYFWGLQPVTNDVGLFFRTDANAGASFDAGSTDYRYYAIVGESGSAVTNANGGTGAAQILLTGGQGIGNVGGEQADGEILIVNPSSTAQTNIFWRIGFVNGDGTAQYVYVTGGGRRMATAAVDAVQLILSSGNIASISYAVEGIRA